MESTEVVHRELVDSESSTSSRPATTRYKVVTESQVSSTLSPSSHPSPPSTPRRQARASRPDQSSRRVLQNGYDQYSTTTPSTIESFVSQADADSVSGPQPAPLSQPATIRQQFLAASSSLRRQPSFGRWSQFRLVFGSGWHIPPIHFFDFFFLTIASLESERLLLGLVYASLGVFRTGLAGKDRWLVIGSG